ncbi:MAG: TaqI-like C-terminal specificity domain-containing protein [Candidatus Azambacteria bacterium]|nr:TaqI-like C-terminal specificity domain-containing protein [Candidatus Azambacteria bacterium]
MNKNEAKKNIQKLIDKYQVAVNAGKISKYSEEETKKDFILPLFEILEWDVLDKNEVSAEESQSSGGRVDYGFYIDSRPKFYLEAKAFRADINSSDFAHQAIRYSWNKGITWAVLTNFEKIIVFNASNTEGMLGDKLLFSIDCSEYIERFDQLWQLSKESFKEDSIDKYAEQIGKKLQKVSVNAMLYKDLANCRAILTNSISQCNPKVDKDLIDEGVQRLLDRLIFIRVAEDRKIEPPTLIQILHEWETKGRGSIPLYQAMIKKFRELDEIYNSNLFSEHSFENWEEYGGAMEKVIPILYGKKGYYEYDFQVMPADVLGGIYENYLSYRLSKSKKGTTINKDAKKRKEQGIYYTPTFIVDYIVKNSLKPILDQCKSIADLKKIKVLDPACGSGSFLIKALEVISEKYKKFHYDDAYTKLQILTENIYGVDLDEQAVEIARLNLLINALDSKNKLPILANNIKNGNSLISGTDEELKKYFGKNYRDKKPFNWEEEFPEVFVQGGFDVVIGNPPWGAGIDSADKSFYKDRFITGKGIIDTFALFTEKSIKLLNETGRWGFILPDILLLKDYPQIRKLILDNFIIKDIYYTGMAFHGVNLDSVVLMAGKEKSEIKRKENNIRIIIDNGESEIKQKLFLENTNYKFNIHFDDDTLDLKKKLDEQSVKLGDVLEIHEGIHSGNIRAKLFLDVAISKNCQKLLFKGVEVERYFEHWAGKFVNYDKSIIDKNNKEYANFGKMEYFKNEKILVRRTGDKIIATIDKDGYFTSNNFFVLYPKNQLKKINLKYILAILNSNLGTWYFTAIQPRKGKLFAEIKINHLAEIPIVAKNNFKEVVELVDRMLDLRKQIHATEKSSNKWQKLKDEIEKTDKKIDEEVYKLYGLTPTEIKIVEK